MNMGQATSQDALTANRWARVYVHELEPGDVLVSNGKTVRTVRREGDHKTRVLFTDGSALWYNRVWTTRLIEEAV